MKNSGKSTVQREYFFHVVKIVQSLLVVQILLDTLRLYVGWSAATSRWSWVSSGHYPVSSHHNDSPP